MDRSLAGTLEPEFAGLQAGKRRKALAQGVQTHQLGLHLAELHRHGVEIFPEKFLGLAPLGLLGRPHQGIQEGKLELASVAYRDPEQTERKAENQHPGEHHCGDQVPIGQGQGLRPAQPARNKNNMHAAFP
jgi:hypothetical protein